MYTRYFGQSDIIRYIFNLDKSYISNKAGHGTKWATFGGLEVSNQCKEGTFDGFVFKVILRLCISDFKQPCIWDTHCRGAKWIKIWALLSIQCIQCIFDS